MGAVREREALLRGQLLEQRDLGVRAPVDAGQLGLARGPHARVVGIPREGDRVRHGAVEVAERPGVRDLGLGRRGRGGGAGAGGGGACAAPLRGASAAGADGVRPRRTRSRRPATASAIRTTLRRRSAW